MHTFFVGKPILAELEAFEESKKINFFQNTQQAIVFWYWPHKTAKLSTFGHLSNCSGLRDPFTMHRNKLTLYFVFLENSCF